jgi:hypothetical protein
MLKEKALDRTQWWTRQRRGYDSVISQISK